MPILTDEERLGTTLAGKYVLDSLIGRGGMGTVFAGHHALSGRGVAVKILHPQHVRDPIAVRRFLNEARATSSFRHPNVVDVLDVDVLDDSTVYLVLELLEGETLGELLHREGKLSLETTLSIVLPVLRALTLAHRLNIIHRDLKPDNIFLTESGGELFPVLLDFGIAKMLDVPEQSVETVTGAIIGTPQYMAPEQALGVSVSTPQLDVYAMGVVVFECLAGQRPIDGPNPATVLARLVTGMVPTLSSVADWIPESLSNVVAKALALQPEHRDASCEQFATALYTEAEHLGVKVHIADGTARLSTPSDASRTQRLRALSNPDASMRRATSKATASMPPAAVAPTMSEDELRDSRPAKALPAASVERVPHSTFAPTTTVRTARADRASLLVALVAFVVVGGAGIVTLRRADPPTVPAPQTDRRAPEAPSSTLSSTPRAARPAPVAAPNATPQPAIVAANRPSALSATPDGGAIAATARRVARTTIANPTSAGTTAAASATGGATPTQPAAGANAGQNPTRTTTRTGNPTNARPPEVAREW
jgi:serine/threonine protein kinase